MARRQREPEFSEETERLVRELGEFVAPEEASVYAGDTAAAYLRASRTSAIMLDVAGAIREAEEERETHEAELMRLERQRERLGSRMSEVERKIAEMRYRGEAHRRARFKGRASLRVPEYLTGIRSTIAEHRSGFFWLYGEDARERRRAVESIISLLRTDPSSSWITVLPDLEGRRRARTEPPVEANQLTYAIRAMWDSMGEEDSRSRGFIRHLMERRFGAKVGLAIILAEFPSRRRHSVPFLNSLWREPRLGKVPVLLSVSTEEATPNELRDVFQPILCESRWTRLGRNLSSMRLQKRWNRQQLAARAGVPAPLLATLEAGLREDVSPAVLARIADALGVSPQELDEQEPRRDRPAMKGQPGRS